MNNPTITVTSFKPSGKYYSTNKSALKPEHYEVWGFQLTTLIQANDPSVRDYAGLSSAFNGDFRYVIEVDYGDKQDFCFFLLDNVRSSE